MAASEQHHTVPIALVSQLVELVKRWNIPAAELLSAVRLDEKALEDPFVRIRAETMCTLLDRARTLTGEPGLGYYLGLQTRATLYGHLAFAFLSAATIGDGLKLVLEFAPIFSTALGVDLRVEGRVAALSFEEQADLGSVRHIVLISTIVRLRAIARPVPGPHT